MKGGYRTEDAEGETWHGHHWIESTGGAILVDITADQFDAPPVRVLGRNAPDRGRYRGNYTPQELENAMHNARLTGLAWTAACRPLFMKPDIALRRNTSLHPT